MIARVTPAVRDEIRRMGNKIHIGLANYHVLDRFYIKRCNKCQSYHHYENVCNKHVICGYCTSQEHVSKDCPKKNSSPKKEHSCYNCVTSGKDESVYKGHNTMWYHCPTYIVEQNKLKKTINYDYNSLN